MPVLEESLFCDAPPLQVWKLLHDPVRFSEWWSGVQRSEPTREGADFYAQDQGVYPMHIATTGEASRVVIRCTVTENLYTWALEPDGDGCRVRVRVEVLEDADERVRACHDGLLASLPRLAAVAERVDR